MVAVKMAKRQVTDREYFIHSFVSRRQKILGLDWSTPNHGPIQKGVLGSVGNINTSVKAGADSNHEIEPLRVSL